MAMTDVVVECLSAIEMSKLTFFNFFNFLSTSAQYLLYLLNIAQCKQEDGY